MKRIVIALTALSFLAAPAAMAQSYPSHHGKPSHGQMHKGGPKYDARRYDDRRHQSWRKGNRLPPNYRGHVVNNYSRYKAAPAAAWLSLGQGQQRLPADRHRNRHHFVDRRGSVNHWRK